MISETFFAVRVQRTDREKPCNVVIRTDTPEKAQAAVSTAYGVRIGHVKAIEQITKARITSAFEDFGDVRNENGFIYDLPGDPRFPALAEHIFLFRFSAKDSASALVPIQAGNEDMAWRLIAQMLMGREIEGLELAEYVQDVASINLEDTVLRERDHKYEEWVGSYAEVPVHVRRGINFRTFCALHVNRISFDRAGILWPQIFDDRRNGGETISVSYSQIEALIAETLPKNCPDAVTAFANDLQRRLRSELSY
jgi:hypothetical protein